MIEEAIPDAFHNTDQYANNRAECDHGRLKSRLKPTTNASGDQTMQQSLTVTSVTRTDGA